MKGILLEIIKVFSIHEKVEFIRSKNDYYHPGKSADITINDDIIGSFGELHPRLMKKFQVKQQTVLGNIVVDFLLKDFSYKVQSNEFKPSSFLTLKKDFSFILPFDKKVGDLVNAIKSSNENIGGFNF